MTVWNSDLYLMVRMFSSLGEMLRGPGRLGAGDTGEEGRRGDTALKKAGCADEQVIAKAL